MRFFLIAILLHVLRSMLREFRARRDHATIRRQARRRLMPQHRY
jgi:hypothetical protein